VTLGLLLAALALPGSGTRPHLGPATPSSGTPAAAASLTDHASDLGTPDPSGAAAALQLTGAATCRPGTCTGKDPKATGCDRAARTVREFTTIDTRIELRYSARCRSAWTRATTTKSHSVPDMAFIVRHNRSGSTTRYFVHTGLNRGEQRWTKMITRTSGSHFQSCNFINARCTKQWP
jgi:hypothetical protein